MDQFDAIVIGSGFGGAVAACRLSQAKLRTLVLERGRRYDNGETGFPRDWQNPANGWLWACGQGLFDVKPIPEMVVVEAAGYGGGSLIYANVHLRPPPDVFDAGWPAGYSRDALDPYFDLVAYMLDIKSITAAAGGLPPKASLFVKAATSLGRGAQVCHPNLAIDFGEPGIPHKNKFDVLQAGCTQCGECDIGCSVRAKNTLDLNYLAVAEHEGAEVRCMSEVAKIGPGANGYEVTYFDHATGVQRVVAAKSVFVCAGAVNSTTLLLRCRDEHGSLPTLPASLGGHYSANGDFLAFAFDTEPPFQPSAGPTITTALVYDRTDANQRTWFTLQDGGYPKEIGRLMQLLRPESAWAKGAETWLRDELAERASDAAAGVSTQDSFPGTAVFLAMGRDRAMGTLSLHPISGAPSIQWDLADNLPLYGAESRVVDDVVKALGGVPGSNPLWERFHQPVSVHNLGGCTMSDDPGGGVTDGEGKVHGQDGLYVLDGAILPAATGVNPSHTIAAVAERNIERFIRRITGNEDWLAPERAKAKPMDEPMGRVSVPAGGTGPTRELPIGLAFTEVMKGFVTTATTEPKSLAEYVAAEQAAEDGDHRAEFTLTITMSDLDRFLEDPTHMGQAIGSIVIAGVTPPGGSPVTHGVFNLFKGVGEAYRRQMLYALPFVGEDGSDYCLYGFKDVKDHGHFDVWGSTSTLYSVVRRGRLADSPVIAAGIFYIRLPDFLHQLTTFRVLQAASVAQRAAALSRFGQMFLGSLWTVFGSSKFGAPDPGAEG